MSCIKLKALGRRLARLALLPSPSAHSIAKVEVFDDEWTVTTGHGRTAGAACYLAIDGLRSCFTLDDLIKGITVQTSEEKRALSAGMITLLGRVLAVRVPGRHYQW